MSRIAIYAEIPDDHADPDHPSGVTVWMYDRIADALIDVGAQDVTITQYPPVQP